MFSSREGLGKRGQERALCQESIFSKFGPVESVTMLDDRKIRMGEGQKRVPSFASFASAKVKAPLESASTKGS